jgi:hypothetical protein
MLILSFSTFLEVLNRFLGVLFIFSMFYPYLVGSELIAT